MTQSEAKAIMETYLKGWETGDRAYFEGVLAPEFVDYMYGKLRTRDELLKEAAEMPYRNRRIRIDDLIVDGDKVALRVTSFLTHPKRDVDAEVPGMIFVRIVNGKMIEGWGLHDRLGAVQQFDNAESREA